MRTFPCTLKGHKNNQECIKLVRGSQLVFELLGYWAIGLIFQDDAGCRASPSPHPLPKGRGSNGGTLSGQGRGVTEINSLTFLQII